MTPKRKTPEHILLARRAQYASDPEKYRQRAREQRRRTGKTYRNPAKQRETRLISRYGITQAQFFDMLRAQQWSCAICKACFIGFAPDQHPSTMLKPCVDHDHKTGKVRGILCNDCNALLGYAKDSMLTMLEAITYLARSK